MRSRISSFIVIGHGSRTHGSFTASIYLVLIWFLSSGRIRSRKWWTEISYWLIALDPDQVFVSVTATQMILVRWPWPSLNRPWPPWTVLKLNSCCHDHIEPLLVYSYSKMSYDDTSHCTSSLFVNTTPQHLWDREAFEPLRQVCPKVERLQVSGRCKRAAVVTVQLVPALGL